MEATVSTHTIHVFISHSWAYSEHYDTLSDWIFNENWSIGQASLEFKDYSVPKDDPLHTNGTVRELKEKIYDKIKRSHVIVIPTGMYANYSKWIQKELDGAAVFTKPILAVNPWGQEKKSSVVQEAANQSVGWNKKSVVTGIWNLFKE